MDKREAQRVLAEKLAVYSRLTHADLAAKIGDVDCLQVTGPSGAEYQIEIQVFWDHEPGGDLMVSGGIDDGGLSAFRPLCDSFIVKPEGTVLGNLTEQ